MQPSSCDEDDIDRKVRDIVARCLGKTSVEVSLDARLFADLGADSLDVIDVTYQIERLMGVPLDGPERNFLAALNSVPPDALVGDDVSATWLGQWSGAFPGLSTLLVHDVVARGQLKDLITVKAFAELVRARMKTTDRV